MIKSSDTSRKREQALSIVGNNVSLESNNFRNTYEGDFTNISAGGETVRKPVEKVNITDVLKDGKLRVKRYAEAVLYGGDDINIKSPDGEISN